jgi:hypothetical protein
MLPAIADSRANAGDSFDGNSFNEASVERTQTPAKAVESVERKLASWDVEYTQRTFRSKLLSAACR